MAELLPPVIVTPRLILRLPELADLRALVGFYTRNYSFLQPYSPIFPEGFLEEPYWLFHISRCAEELRSGLSTRFVLFDRAAPERMLGAANLTAIQRGPAQFCFLGYSTDKDMQGKGLMSEALGEGVLPYAFEQLDLHRVQANYMPTNERSGRLLRKLGFIVEGYARDYLRINGRWEDHILTSLVSPQGSQR